MKTKRITYRQALRNAKQMAKFFHKHEKYGNKSFYKGHILEVVKEVKKVNKEYINLFAKVTYQFKKETYQLSILLAYIHDIGEKLNVTIHNFNDSDISKEIVFQFHKGIFTEFIGITRVKTETYFGYINNVETFHIARLVKIADLRVNLRQCLKDNKYSLMERYIKALKILEND